MHTSITDYRLGCLIPFHEPIVNFLPHLRECFILSHFALESGQFEGTYVAVAVACNTYVHVGFDLIKGDI